MKIIEENENNDEKEIMKRANEQRRGRERDTLLMGSQLGSRLGSKL